MKKLILLFVLVLSTFTFAQNKEFIKTYEQAFTLREGKFNHYQTPSTVYYYYKNSNYILIKSANKNLVLKILSEKSEIIENENGRWVEFYVETEDGKRIKFGVFEKEIMGCMLTDGVLTMGFNNVKQ